MVLENKIIEKPEIDKFKDLQKELNAPAQLHNDKQSTGKSNQKDGELATIKKAGEKEILTPAQFKAKARELKKCKEDILYFCRKYFKIVSLKDGLVTLDPYPKQAELLKFIQNNNRSIVCASRQVGKCLSGNTKIHIRHKKFHWLKIDIPIGFLYLVCKVKRAVCNFFKKLYN